VASSATIPNSDLVFTRDGVGDRAIMFVHGFLDDQDIWKPVLSELVAPGFETVRLDLAGFGGRTEAHGPFTFDRFAADLLAVLDTVGKPFVLVGHSMAAPVVELVASARPDSALGLVLLSPIPMAGTRLPDSAVEPFRTLGDLGPQEHQAARQQGAPSAPEAELERIGAVAAKVRPEVVRTVANLWNDGYPSDRRLGGFTGPALLLPGADDPLITAEVVTAEATARFDRTKTVITAIEKAGHWPHLEHPSVVATEIDRFLAKYLPANTAAKPD
jgi:pimeloyl-ACP methyl ester carboxylesterase